jgi:DNA replication and repair protein RecF
MNITSLRLRQFRSYDDFSIELSPSVNIIVGPNASGKTNLLEAFQVAGVGSSFRARDADLIKFDHSGSKIEMVGPETTRIVKLVVQDEKLIKSINIDNVEIRRLTFNKILPIVLFEPEHLRMIHGSPEKRRDYLDNILELTIPTYKNTLRQYKRALAQRNRLLKLGHKVIKDQLFVWDVKLSEFGAMIMESRIALISRINQDANEVYCGLSGLKNDVELKYISKINTKDIRSGILKGLNQRFGEDILRGFTSIGPHRDDVQFLLNKHDAQTSASRGETRSLVLMCKIIELKIVEEIHSQKPVLLLDDVFSELDSKRRRALTRYLKDYQVIITTTDADSVLEHFLKDTNVIAL